MFFSVVIPVYNVEKYLPQCVDSILSQTFCDYEVLLVNDGSTDASAQLCDEYAQKDARVRVIHKENGGQASARNIGVDQACGEYIIFLDSDDFFMHNAVFESICNSLNGADVLCCKHADYEDVSQKFSSCRYTYPMIPQGQTMTKTLETLVENDAYYGTAWGKAIKTSLLQENEIKFDESLSCEDMDWFYQVICKASSLVLLDEVCVAYRQRAGSVTKTLKLKNITDFVFTLKKWHSIATSEQPPIDSEKKQVVLCSLAKYYSNLLIAFTRVKDPQKKQFVKDLRALSVLLQHAVSSRPQIIRKIHRVLGFHGTILALKTLDTIRG